MECLRCGAINLDDARYCSHCGAALSSTVGRPGAQTKREATAEAVQSLRRFIPSVVAEGILHDQERLRGERREVAVLFADAVNFTHLSASLDAEPVFNLINDLLSRLVACIHRYDGVVDKFTGDGLMAVFGAPIAHENDAELAVRAALDMQKAAAEFAPVARAQLGAPVQIRIGIHNGPTIAGIIGTEEQAAYTVIGETVNLAARLESLARPGFVLVSSRVYQRTRALFNFQPMGTTQVKGLDQPLAVYEAIGDRSEPLPTRGVAGATTVFLGRDAELASLRESLDAFLNDRRGRLVVIRGEAGIGKSRLVGESLPAGVAERAAVWRGRGLPYAQGVGYGIFRSLLQDFLRTSPPGTAWDAQVSSALRPFLGQILGVALSPAERTALRNLEPERVKQLTALALREWLLGEARKRPIVLILEDFHWADGLSRDVSKSLINLVGEAPVFVGIVTRPQPESPLPFEADAEQTALAPLPVLSLTLEPLSPEHSRALLGHLVDLESLPEQIIRTILTRAEGNPLYIEEFVRMLIEKDVLTLEDGQWRVVSAMALQELEIPTTLRGLMMARVDRLPEDLQHVLRTAAVIGLQFAARLLGEVEHRIQGESKVSPRLERLIDLGMLEERPEAGERVFAFRHILTQETIYNSLLRSQRPGLHRTVAESIETLYATELDQHAEVLALHYDRARVRDKAMGYALRAGDRARARFANDEAIEFYSRALQLSQHLSDCRAERWQSAVGLGQIQQHVGEYEEAIACYQAALEEWEEAPADARARVQLRMGEVWNSRGDLDQAESWLRDGLAELDQEEGAFPELRAQIYSELGWLHFRQGDLTAAREWLGRGLPLVTETDHLEVLSSLLNRLGAVYYNRSEWDQAVTSVERALALRERLGDLVGYARSLNNLGILKWASGDWDGALENYERAVEMHERIDEVEGLALACMNLGLLYTDRGEWVRAEENLRRSFAIAQRIGHSFQLALAHMNLGRHYLLQRRWEACAQHLNAAIPLYQEAGARASLHLSAAYELQGRLHLERGQIDAALEWATRSFELLAQVTDTEAGDSVEWGRYERLMGRIALARGELDAARRHLERGLEIFRAAGSQIEAGRTAYWISRLWCELGRAQRARDLLATALEIFERLGAAADLERAQEQRDRLRRPET